MTDIHGGRVLAGEDSEEDDEDDEAYSFQFGGFGSQSGASSSAPRFAVPTVVVAPQAGGEESDEEDEEEEEKNEEAADASEQAAPKPASESDDNEEDETRIAAGADEHSSDAVNAEGEATASENASKSSVSGIDNGVKSKDLAAAASSSAKDRPMERNTSREDDGELWSVDPSMDGPQMMGDAFVRNIQPSLDASIQRIDELRSNQKRLLQLLVDQNASVASNKQIEDAAVVLDKLPHYFTKIQMIRAAMTEISASVDKMKRRAESLRIDAQSHALKKENKRDAQSQWNKLYAAKSAAPPSASRES